MDAYACTCPYEWGGACKHVVATLLTPIEAPEEAEERPSLAELVGRLDRDALARLLLRRAEIDPGLAGWIEAECAAAPGGGADLAPVAAQARAVLAGRYAERDYDPPALQAILNGEGGTWPPKGEAGWTERERTAVRLRGLAAAGRDDAYLRLARAAQAHAAAALMLVRLGRIEEAVAYDAGAAGDYGRAAEWLRRAALAHESAGLTDEWSATIEALIERHRRKYKLRPLLEALRF